MNEKKLTDEEIVKALEDCNREYTDMNRHSCDTCPYRYIEPCGKAQMTGCIDLIHRLQAENAELQKQVDELRAKNKSLGLKALTLSSENKMLIEVCNDCDNVKQAAKDTAKEILQKIMNIIKKSDGFLAEEVIRILAKQKGVEVE